MKYQYWYRYSTLDWDAEVVRVDSDAHPAELNDDEDFSNQYYGPFTSLKEARTEALAKINDDIESFRQMKRAILGPATILKEYI